MSRLRFALVLVCASAVMHALAASLAFGQADGTTIRPLQWDDSSLLSPRAAGLGGAYVAIANDFSAALLNPAGVAACPKSVEGGLSWIPGGTSTPGGHAERRGEGAFSAVARIRCRWGAGAFYERPASLRIETGPEAQDLLEGHVEGPGFALGYRAHHGLEIGFSLRRLRLVTDSHLDSGAFTPATATLAGRHSRWDTAWTAGLLFNLHPRMHTGLVYRSGAQWSLVRKPLADASASNSYDSTLRLPSVVSAGLAWEVRLGHRRDWMILAGQADLVRYSEIGSSLLAAGPASPPAGYDLDDAVDLRAGLEVNLPLGCWSGCGTMAQLRFGLHRRGSLSPSLESGDPADSALLAATSARWVGSAGVSFSHRVFLPLRLDIAMRFAEGARPVLVFGLAFRYGWTFGDAGPR